MDLNRCREVGYQALDRLDREQALTHQLDRIAPSRRAQWPKDDERSSARVRRANAADGDSHNASRGD